MRTLLLIPTIHEARHLVASEATPLRAAAPFLGGRLTGGAWALCGVGPAAAALTATHLIHSLQPTRVLLAGIAGCYPHAGLEPGDLVQVKRETWADLGYVTAAHEYRTLDHMQLPQLTLSTGNLGSEFDLAPWHHGPLSAVNALTVAGITNDHERAVHLGQQFDAAIENMEGCGVALACKVADVPCSELRAISNWVGPRNPSAWLIEGPLQRLGTLIRQSEGFRGMASS